jgi:hypothetical protein
MQTSTAIATQKPTAIAAARTMVASAVSASAGAMPTNSDAAIVNQRRAPRLRGIRVGELKTGKVLYRIPDPLEMKGTSAAEGIAVDARGNVYGGEVGPRQLAKHLKQ